MKVSCFVIFGPKLTPNYFLPQPQDKKNYLKIFFKISSILNWPTVTNFCPLWKIFYTFLKKNSSVLSNPKISIFSKNVSTLQDVRWPRAKLLILLHTPRWILIKHNSNTLGQLQIKLQGQGNNNVFPPSQKFFLKLIFLKN